MVLFAARPSQDRLPCAGGSAFKASRSKTCQRGDLRPGQVWPAVGFRDAFDVDPEGLRGVTRDGRIARRPARTPEKRAREARGANSDDRHGKPRSASQDRRNGSRSRRWRSFVARRAGKGSLPAARLCEHNRATIILALKPSLHPTACLPGVLSMLVAGATLGFGGVEPGFGGSGWVRSPASTQRNTFFEMLQLSRPHPWFSVARPSSRMAGLDYAPLTAIQNRLHAVDGFVVLARSLLEFFKFRF